MEKRAITPVRLSQKEKNTVGQTFLFVILQWARMPILLTNGLFGQPLKAADFSEDLKSSIFSKLVEELWSLYENP